MTFSKILTDQRDKKREGEVSSSLCNGVPMGNARSRMWMGVLVFGLLFLLTCSDSKDSGNGDNGDNGNGNGDTTHKYSCTNGTAASGEAASENTEKCDSCKDGYKLTDAKSCVAIKYTCTNGTEASGEATSEGTEKCASCKDGYKLTDAESCAAIKYTCTNGTEASGEATSEGTEKCANCKDGYKLTDAESCAAIKYTCTNGTVKAGAPTTGNADVEFCTACNSSYGIAGNQCLMITTINGTADDDDSLNGTPGPNIINGLAGDDVLKGLAGNDELNGGDGADTLNGGAGADVLDGGAGADTADYTDASAGVVVYLKASEGSNEGEAAGDTYNSIENLAGSVHDDTLQGDDDPNTINGGAGNDTIYGGAGIDLIKGGAGNDTIYGGAGIDLIYGGAGIDTIYGGAGIDTIYGGAGIDTMTGGGGSDTFELEITHSDKDIVTDFAKGDTIGVGTTAGTESTLVALKAAADIDWVNTANHDTGTTTNDASIYDTVISDTKGTTDTADDVVIMVLEDYTTPLVIGDFEVY